MITHNKKSPAFLGIRKGSSEDLTFILSPEAIAKPFSHVDMPNLINEWRIQALLSAYFSVYSKITKFVSLFLLMIQFSAWSYLAFTFFFSTIFTNLFAVNWLIFRPFMGPASRFYATETRKACI